MNSDHPDGRNHQDQAAVEQLLLVRLLVPASRAPTAGSIKKQLAPFFTHRLSTAEWNGLFEAGLSSVCEAGLMTVKPLGLTDSGRTRALSSIRMKQVPPGLKWNTLRDVWLTPLALQAPVEDPQTRDRLKSADRLKGYILKQEYQLSLDKYPTLKESLDALIWKQLGIETDRSVTRDALIELVLGHLLDPTGPLKKSVIQSQLPAKAIGATRTTPDQLRLAAIRRWIARGEASPEPSSEQSTERASASSNGNDLALFAERVRAAARASVTGRFGPNKVFIRQVWRQLAPDPDVRTLDLETFKTRLVAAHRAGLVSLSRADLVEAMDPDDVAASETRHLNAVFHFVTLVGDRSV